MTKSDKNRKYALVTVKTNYTELQDRIQVLDYANKPCEILIYLGKNIRYD